MSSGTIGLLIGGQREKLTASGSLTDTVDKCVFNKRVADQLMTETHTFQSTVTNAALSMPLLRGFSDRLHQRAPASRPG
jgi:hypothetical protein